MARADGPVNEGTIVDPESLLLLSIAYADDELRLKEIVGWWARVGSPLTSIGRMKGIVAEIESESQDYFTTYATLAARSGHRNWQRHADQSWEEPWYSNAGGPDFITPRGGGSLMIRLRAAFGVGAKSDILSFLIGNRDSASSVAHINRAVGYTKTAVRGSLRDMVTAGLVDETASHPANYSTNRRAWGELLQISTPNPDHVPKWCLWISVFGFLIRTRELLTLALENGMNDHVVASRARDLTERYSYAFNHENIQLPRLTEYPGREFARAFLVICENVEDWARSQ